VLKTQVLTGAFASGFALALMAKDVKIAADLADGLSLDLPMLRFTDERWRAAVEEAGGDQDNTVVFRLWDDAARRKRRGA
jgi:3-hydroxyisobutyrate dehydrogenase